MSASLVVIDAANVVGSRPDGWWRDRAGAAARLLTELEDRFTGKAEVEVVVVLEGAARRAAPAGRRDGTRVVHAGGSGDDTIVEVVERAVAEDRHAAVTVVTADRALRDRVARAGGRTRGPTWLRQGEDC